MSQPSNPWAAQFAQLTNPLSRQKPSAPVHNPRPPGVIRNGRATHVLWELFQAHPHRYFTHAEILWRTKRTKRAIDWALIYLRSQQLIDCASGNGGNVRYLRYRFIEGNHVKAQVSQATQTAGVSKTVDAQQIFATNHRLVTKT